MLKPLVMKRFVSAVKILAAAALSVLAVSSCAGKHSSEDAPVVTFEDAKAVFAEKFGIEEGTDWLREFELYPVERLYVDVPGHKLCFIDADEEVMEFVYEDVASMSSIKKLDSDSKGPFNDWIVEYLQVGESFTLDSLKTRLPKIQDSYMDQIDSYGDTELDKIFSIIYNAIVGSEKPFLATLVRNGHVQKVEYSDFASQKMNEVEFIEAVRSLQETDSEYDNAYMFLKSKELLSSAGNLQFCYWNNRQDKLYINTKGEYKFAWDSAASALKTDPQVEGFKEDIAYHPDRIYVLPVSGDSLKDLADLYQNLTVLCSPDMEMLKDYKMVPDEKKTEGPLWLWIVIGVVVLLLIAGALIFIFRKKIPGLLRGIFGEKVEDAPYVEDAPEDKGAELSEYLRRLKDEGKLTADELMDHCEALFGRTRTKLEELTTEEDLLKELDRIRRKNPTFPKIKTFAGFVGEVEKDKAEDQVKIRKILDAVCPSLIVSYDRQRNEAKEYGKCQGLLRENGTSHTFYEYVQSMIDNLLSDDRKVAEKYMDFVSSFVSSDPQKDAALHAEASALRTRYAAVDNVVEELTEAFARVKDKDVPDYWDRLYLFISMAAASKGLLGAYDDKTLDGHIDSMCDRFKADVQYLYVTRNFLASFKNGTKAQDFADDVMAHRVMDKFNEFNAGLDPLHQLNLEDPAVKDCMAQCINAIARIRPVFSEHMWEKHAKPFLENVSTNRDKGWLLARCIQLAFCFADYLRHTEGGADAEYCPNYIYMTQDTLPSGCMEFKHNDYRYSDEYTNFIYEFLSEYGATGVDVILNNFNVKS